MGVGFASGMVLPVHLTFITTVNNGNSQPPIMAERRSRFPFWRGRASSEDTERLNNLLNQQTSSVPTWDGKTLASMSRIGNATKKGVSTNKSRPKVNYELIRDISLKNEVVNAILRRTVDDCLGNGYEFSLPEGREEGSPEQLARLKEFFRNPNPDDNGDEWLESLIYDLQLFGDAYLELDGSEDRATDKGETKWIFGGELVSIWNVPAETITLVPANRKPKPPAMAYIQELDGLKREFSADKILHISKFKHGRAYGTSPVIPLLSVIAGHLNLSSYMNELYTGTLPKTILNVGDISNGEMKAMLSLLEQQLAGGKSPFGLVAVNGGNGFAMHKLLDSTREGAQLEMIHYYREEICAVFGIPPMKLGWVQTGKMSNPEQQLDAWYDVIESFHNRVESLINNRILPLLEVEDWQFKFISIRPKRDKEIAEMKAKQSTAISNLRQEGVISINEARNMLGLERLELEEADDPMFLSPKLSINKGKVDGGSSDDVGGSPPSATSLSELFPPPKRSDEPAPERPPLTIELDTVELTTEQEAMLSSRRMKQSDEFEELITNESKKSLAEMEDQQSVFADSYIEMLDQKFNDSDSPRPNPDVDIELNISSSKASSTKAVIDLDDIEDAIFELDLALERTVERQYVNLTGSLTTSYGATLDLTLAGTGIAAGLNADDIAAISYWGGRWQLPALRNTVGAHRANVIDVFERMVAEGQSWRWAKGEMRELLDPTGANYPAYWLERIARTETRRVVENAHISGLRKAGFEKVQRLVVIDETTDRDLCAPYENEIYPIDESRSVIPAHPNCRCTFVAYDGDAQALPSEDILRPDVEGAE